MGMMSDVIAVVVVVVLQFQFRYMLVVGKTVSLMVVGRS